MMGNISDVIAALVGQQAERDSRHKTPTSTDSDVARNALFFDCPDRRTTECALPGMFFA
jgi:hypothetical protein